jgi:hypothetical protein
MPRVIWKEIAWLFGVSRMLFLVVSTLGRLFLAPQSDRGTPAWLMWDRWDASYYARIAFQGYKVPSDKAFYPLWPLLEHLLGCLLPMPAPTVYYVIGVILANLFFFFALVMVYKLVARDVDARVAKRTVWFLTWQPYGLFYALGYTESLFLLLCVFALWFLGQEHWWWAAGCGFLATLTRGTGIVLVVPCCWLLIERFRTFVIRQQMRSKGQQPTILLRQQYQSGYVLSTSLGKQAWIAQRRKTRLLRLHARSAQRGNLFAQRLFPSLAWWLMPERRKMLALAVIPLLISGGTLLYMLYLVRWHGNALAFSTQEATYWGRHLSVPGAAVIDALENLVHPSTAQIAAQNLLDLLFCLLPCTILVVGWRMIPRHYALLTASVALYSLCFPITVKTDLLFSQPLTSQPRYMIVAFPLFVILAIWGKRPLVEHLFFAVSLPFLALHLILFSSGVWVA